MSKIRKSTHSNVISMLGASSHGLEQRQCEDFYATDPKTVDLFIKQISKDGIVLNKNIWECACGDGVISEKLLSYGHNVLSTDKYHRGYPSNLIHTLDFTQNVLKFDGDILTNPPYKHVNAFVLKGLESIKKGNKLILFLRLNFLETISRYEKIFNNYPPKYIYVHSKRVSTYKNNETKYKEKPMNAVCFSWFIWEKGNTSEPIVRWIVDKNYKSNNKISKGWSC